MTLFSRHLDAVALGLLVIAEEPDPRADAHLASCARCRRERDRVAAVLADARDGADAAIDAVFGPADLERQRHAILQRIAKSGGAGRVLRFPHGADQSAPMPRTDPRWLIVAAAAGLLLGVAAGQVPHLLNSSRVTPGVARVVTPAAPAPADWRVDDTLLSEVDAALDSDTRPELEALDALTPVHYETR